MTNLDEFEEALQVIVEDGFFERRLECLGRCVDRRRNATVVLEDTAGHSTEGRSLLPRRRPSPTSHRKYVHVSTFTEHSTEDERCCLMYVENMQRGRVCFVVEIGLTMTKTGVEKS